MADAADVLGEPVTKMLGGREIKFEMFNFGLVAEFQRQQKRAFDAERHKETKRQKDALTEIEGLSPYDRGRLCIEIDNTGPQFDLIAAMFGVEGSIEMLALCARKYQPDMTAAQIGKLLPFSRAQVQKLVNELTPAALVTVDEQRSELIGTGRMRLEAALEQPTREKMREAGIKALETLYQATGEVLPEKYGGQVDPPAETAPTS